jgi:hypothetical protein
MAAKRVASFPPEIIARLQKMLEAHQRLPRPEGAGRQIRPLAQV